MPTEEYFEFDLNRQISSQKAFLIIIVLSFVVAIYTIIAARKVVDNVQNSTTFNIQERYQPNIDSIKSSTDNTLPINIKNTGK